MQKKLSLILIISTLFICGKSFAGTRQAVYRYNGNYAPTVTYVFVPAVKITILKKPEKQKMNLEKSVYSTLGKFSFMLKNKSSIASHVRIFRTFITYGFNFNSFAINKLVKSKLINIDKSIKSGNYKVLSITGYTDHFGTKAYNNKLALKRARSAEKFLDLRRIKLYGYGKCCYVSKINRKDRRIVIKAEVMR